ncbi:MAG TPA: ABC transporter ATP-binding protein [Gemmatimonadales bacterium]|nr:ABC transporter ATP-binding protein [Gemmatimonadales bacterium]
MRELRTLLPYLRRYRVPFAAGLGLVVLSNYFTTLAPQFLQRGIDALERGQPLAEVTRAAAWLVGVALAGGVLRYGMRELLNGASRRVEYRLRNDLYRHLQGLSAEFYDRYPTGDLIARATNDLLAVRMVAGPAIMYLVDTITRSLLIVPYMVAISPLLSVLALLPLLGLPVAMSLLSEAIHRRTTAIQAQFSELTSHVHENLSGVRVVRAYRQEAAEAAHFERLNQGYVDRNLALARLQGAFHPLMALFGGLGAVAVLYGGGRLVIAGRVTVGEFVAFGVYLATLVWPMIALGWVINLVQRGAASMARINALLRERPAIVPPVRPASLPPRRGPRSLAFEGVWFRYPGAADRGWVLRDVSFTLEAGRSLAVVGATGSGKSTLVDLVVRTYDPDRGRILLDGVDIRELEPATLRREIGFVPQETFLFSETLRDNILLGAPDDGRLATVAEVAQLTEALPALPQGFDTLLGERGVNLSGGQKQRTAIARALARDPPVFVLDDALSAVDAQTEARILRGLKRAMTGRTSVIVSHRLSAVRDADRIIVLDRGEIVERGTHQELMARRGRYWELLRRQRLEEELELTGRTTSAPPAGSSPSPRG